MAVLGQHDRAGEPVSRHLLIQLRPQGCHQVGLAQARWWGFIRVVNRPQAHIHDQVGFPRFHFNDETGVLSGIALFYQSCEAQFRGLLRLDELEASGLLAKVAVLIFVALPFGKILFGKPLKYRRIWIVKGCEPSYELSSRRCIRKFRLGYAPYPGHQYQEKSSHPHTFLNVRTGNSAH